MSSSLLNLAYGSRLVFAVALTAAGVSMANTAGATDLLGMPAAFSTKGPNASLGENSAPFESLVGSWAVDYLDISKDGKTRHRTGHYDVAWVLDGHAVQDFWVVDPSGAHPEREVYTDVFYVDPKSHTWHGTFVDPQNGSVANLTAAAKDDELILHTPDLGAADSRLTFEDIRPNSFVYRDEASNDGGKTWRLRAEYHMTRER